jgi:hypothetical protein
MNQTNHFFNLGYGWLCKHCSAADAERTNQPPKVRTGFFGHAAPEKPAASEKKDAHPSGLPLASWTDPSRHALNCPRCGIEETISNA